ncbi:MAG TPA: hypothetical protein DCR40_19265 [Prolixibacteraceae bacterium]|nr:hypothetical protein [Prolixibacteraceae bacterium]
MLNVAGIREQFYHPFPEFRMFIQRKALAGKVKELFVGHGGKVFSVQCSVAGCAIRVSGFRLLTAGSPCWCGFTICTS